jgi:hypothetical protein
MGAEGRGGQILTMSLPAEPDRDVFKALVEEVRPYYSTWIPTRAAQALNPVLFAELSVPSLTPLQHELTRMGLPRYRRTWRENAFHLPNQIGWLNYWCRQTCDDLDFPNRPEDRQRFPESEPVKHDAWLVQLTRDPLDLDKAPDRSALLLAYERFAQLTM